MHMHYLHVNIYFLHSSSVFAVLSHFSMPADFVFLPSLKVIALAPFLHFISVAGPHLVLRPEFYLISLALHLRYPKPHESAQ